MEHPTVGVPLLAELLCKNSDLMAAVVEFKNALGSSKSHDAAFESFSRGSTSAYGLLLDLLSNWVRVKVDGGRKATMGDLMRILMKLGHTCVSSVDKIGKAVANQFPGQMEIHIVIDTIGGVAVNPPGFVKFDNSPTMDAIKLHRANKLEKSWNCAEISNKFQRGVIPTEVQNQLEGLPIFKMKSALVEAVRNNQVIIVVGEAGSGKSTQIPTYLAEAGFCQEGIIGCTQPRRIAAKSVAERVSVECGTALGTVIGYSVRFDKCYSKNTMIKFMTDGTLIRDFVIGKDMSEYSVLIIDEAHERSQHTDVCFGLLKSVLKNHPKLKVIVTSATLEEDKFSRYFDSAPIINVSGTMFEVTEVYGLSLGTNEYLDAAVRTVCNIHLVEGPGDILVFLPGQGDIEKAEELIKRKVPVNSVEIVPCYGHLTLDRQNKIFKPAAPGVRKVALATNIAETSITIPGIVYVVDSGYFKQREYDPESGVEALLLKRITQAQAIQRKGRAGRTAAGKVFRLYSAATFHSMSFSGIPEIQRSNLESVVLQLIATGVHDVFNFDWMSIPKKDALCQSLEKLKDLSALDNNMKLTDAGKIMAAFPLDPTLAKILVTSVELRCSKEVLIITSFLSMENKQVFIQDKANPTLSKAKMRHFNHPDGDQLTYLNIYNAWKSAGRSEVWCSQNFLNFEYLQEVENIIKQLADDMQKCHLPIISDSSGSTVNIRKSIIAGLNRKVAKKFDRFSYKAIGINLPGQLFIHPTSALFPNPNTPAPDYILYTEAFQTTKHYLKGVMAIEPSWIPKT